MTTVLQKKQWRGCTVILKKTDKISVHSPFFLVFNGKTHWAPKGVATDEVTAADWANQKCLSLWKEENA